MTMPLLTASLMMLSLGLVTALVLRRVAVHSWRLRSWLVAAVLLQGLMIVRSPIHLGLIDSSPLPPETAMLHEADFAAFALTGPGKTGLDDTAAGTIFSRESTGELASSRLPAEFDWRSLFLAVWLLVSTTMIVVGLVRYGRILRLVRTLEPAPEPWRKQWVSVSRRSNNRAAKRCQMLVSHQVGPMMVRRPGGYALVVPARYWQSLSDQQRYGVLIHELAHLERRDVWSQLIARMVATLHWFNPMSWWALRQYEFAAECACDQRVASEGKQYATGFASALVELVQCHDEMNHASTAANLRGPGFQAMAAPPLNTRISRLLQPHSGDSAMKRLALASLAASLVLISFFQLRLTSAQDGTAEPNSAQRTVSDLEVISDGVATQLVEIGSQLDLSDSPTERFASLLETPSGKIAISGYLNALSGRSRDEARSEAIPRFAEHHFNRGADGKLGPRPESKAALERWIEQSKRLEVSIAKISDATSDIADRMDTSTEAGGLFKRLLNDPQAPVAVLMNEMDGGDVISRFLSEALDRMLVDQGDGTFRIVESRRREASQQIERFEMAEAVSQRLKRELPVLASEYTTDDDQHEKLVRYLNNPITATIASMQISEDMTRVSQAVEKLHEHFEGVSIDTASGLRITKQEAWDQLEEIYTRVDRAEAMLPRIREKLAAISETLNKDDSLTARFAVQMKREPLAVMIASEIPYAEADPGEELRGMLSEVLTESDGKLSIQRDREDEVTGKARELLQVCRKIRRYSVDIDQMLDQIADRDFVERLGDAGRYTMLSQVRQFAEQHRPDPIALMRQDLLSEIETGRLRVREDRREVVGRLIEQSEKVRSEAANDDF